jgi:signal transduction histidine kinase/CheY-like chemotaxis protein
MAAAPAVSGMNFQDTVRSRLLRFAVLLLLPGLALAGLVTWQSLDADGAAFAAKLRDGMLLLSDRIDTTLGETEGDLRLLVTSDALAAGDMTAFSRLARAMSRRSGRIVLRDAAGTVLVDTAATGTAAQPPDMTPQREALQAGPAETAWGLDPVDPKAGPKTVNLTVPALAGRLRAFEVTAYVPRQRLQEALDSLAPPSQGDVNRPSLNRGWYADIYDSRLQVVARNVDPGRFIGHRAPDRVAMVLQHGGTLVTDGESPDGVADRFAAGHSAVFGIPITLMAPLAAVPEPSRLSLLLLVSIGGVLVSLGLLGALVVSNSISRPIEALAVAARQLGESESLPSIPPGFSEADEVQQAMSAASATLIERRKALSNMNATLAARVEERTSELADANRALDEERTRLGLVLDHMPIGVAVSLPGGEMLFTNHEGRRLLGFDAGQDTYPPDGRPVVRRQGCIVPFNEWPPVLARSGIVTSRDILTLERHDGITLDLEVSAGPVLDRDGEVALAVTTLQDISARLEAEEARRRSQRLEAVGQLTGGVAHEFNNLLMAIGGCLDLLSPHVRGACARGVLENAARATDRGATLTRQLLAFSRSQQLHTEAVDINLLVGNLAELLQTTLGRAYEVVTERAPACWPATADPTQLELVVLNLAFNARDAMPAGGRLVIGTGNAVLGQPRRAEEPPPGEYVMLRVTDTGTGMTTEVLARAFEPFFTTKQAGHGTGLGLPHVLGVAQQLGGGVVVHSTVGEGTTVSVFLPRAFTTPASPRKDVLHPPRRRALEGLRPLLVDDDIEVREVARAMLEEMGAVVTVAPAAQDALLLLRTEANIDLVLADLTMPNMTGVELAQQVTDVLPGVPVILMTGYGASALGDLGPNVRAVLQKPFRAEKLAQVLSEVRGTPLTEAKS